MANHFRVDRVGMEIKREVNEILQKKVRDPRVQGVTITDVQMLGDLSMAKVYYTIMSDLASDNQKAQLGLEKATGTIKRELGHNLKMYKIPDLTFVKDQSQPMRRRTRCASCSAIAVLLAAVSVWRTSCLALKLLKSPPFEVTTKAAKATAPRPSADKTACCCATTFSVPSKKTPSAVTSPLTVSCKSYKKLV